MNNFLAILSATTLSGSFIFGITKLFDKKLHTRALQSQLYLFMKISLLYFLLPGVFIIIILFRIHVYNNLPLKNAQEISGVSIYKILGNIALQENFPAELVVANIIFMIWVLGTVICIFAINLYRAVNLFRLFKLCILIEDAVLSQTLREVALQYKIKKEIVLYRCSYISSPFLFGIFNFKIVIPNIDLSQEEFEIVCKHEFTHCQNHDIFFRNLVSFVRGVNWFNPIILFYSQMFYDYGELACDEIVSKQLTNLQKSRYAHLLIRLYEQPCNISHMVAFSNNNEDFLKRRISIIMKKTAAKKTAASSILAFSIAILSCPLVAFASSWNVSQVYNEVIEVNTAGDNKEETFLLHEYIEYTDKASVPSNKNFIINSVVRGSNSIDFTLPPEGIAVTSEFSATAGKGIKIIVSGDSSLDSFKAGIINKSGERRYVNSQGGSVDYTFDISETGTYAVYFECTGNSEVHILGTIYVNY